MSKQTAIPTKACYVIPAKAGIPPITRHSREGGNPNPSPVIPAKAGIQPITRHSAKANHPSFPRRRESNPSPIIPADGNPSPVIPRRRESNPSPVIPAKAGIQTHHPSFPRRRESKPITRHSREGGITRHSREGGNPNPSPVIPAKAGIQTHSVIRGNDHPTHHPSPSRHSREGGNPNPSPVIPGRRESHWSFPPSRESLEKKHLSRRRESNTVGTLPQRHSRLKRESAVITRHSCEGGNSTRHSAKAGIQPIKFPRRRESNPFTRHSVLGYPNPMNSRVRGEFLRE